MNQNITQKQTILIADDDREFTSQVADTLAQEGFDPVQADSAVSAVKAFEAKKNIVLILFNIRLPGWEDARILLRGKFQSRININCSILLVLEDTQSPEMADVCTCDKDDFIFKPIGMPELVFRIRERLKKDQHLRENENSQVNPDPLKIYPSQLVATLDGRPLDLTTREFQLLWYLYQNRGVVLSRENIFEAVWGFHYGDIGTVAVNIKKLRDKLGSEHDYIKTVWGSGYVFTL